MLADHPPPPGSPTPDRRVRERFEAFVADDPLPRYRRYVDAALAVCDARPHARPGSPAFIPRETYEAAGRIAVAFSRLMRSPTYRETAAASVFDHLPRRPRDYIGNVDLHLGVDGLRIIEAHGSPPGGISIMPAMQRIFAETFALDAETCPLPAFYPLLADCVPPERRGRVAVAVSHRATAMPFHADFRAVAAQLGEHGVDAEMVLAEQVELCPDGLAWRGRRFDDVLSLIIPPNFESGADDFARFMAARARFPDRVFPDPAAGRLATKQMLPLLGALDRWAPELDDEDRAVLQAAALPAAPLAAFDSVDAVIERFGGLDRLVVKPIQGFQARGVLVQPDRAALADAFDRARHAMIVQRFYPGRPMPLLTPDGARTWIDLRLRVLFVRDTFAGCLAMSNPPSPLWLMPTVLI